MFRGTRVPFKILTEYLEGGDTLDQFLEQYPSVTRELAVAAIEEARLSLVSQPPMRVLVDECAPSALKSFLSGHGYDSLTVQEAGWSGKQNGELLNLAETAFDALVTLDTNLQYQQNLTGRKIAIVVLVARSNRLADLSPHFSSLVEALAAIKAGEIIYVGNKS